MIKYYKILLLCFFTMFLFACFGEPAPVPQDSFYTLPEINAAKQKRKFTTISIDTIRATGVYNERAILYLEKNSPLSIKRYHYHHWVMPPAQLVQQQLKSYLASSGIASNVINYRPGHSSDVRVKGTLLRFERVLDDKNAEVRVAIELDVSGAARRLNKQYTTSLAAKDNSFESSAAAFGMAIQKIMQQFVADLEKD